MVRNFGAGVFWGATFGSAPSYAAQLADPPSHGARRWDRRCLQVRNVELSALSGVRQEAELETHEQAPALTSKKSDPATPSGCGTRKTLSDSFSLEMILQPYSRVLSSEDPAGDGAQLRH